MSLRELFHGPKDLVMKVQQTIFAILGNCQGQYFSILMNLWIFYDEIAKQWKSSKYWITGLNTVYMPYILRGFYFREFLESGAIREINNTQKYLPPIQTHECDLCTQY